MESFGGNDSTEIDLHADFSQPGFACEIKRGGCVVPVCSLRVEMTEPGSFPLMRVVYPMPDTVSKPGTVTEYWNGPHLFRYLEFETRERLLHYQWIKGQDEKFACEVEVLSVWLVRVCGTDHYDFVDGDMLGVMRFDESGVDFTQYRKTGEVQSKSVRLSYETLLRKAILQEKLDRGVIGKIRKKRWGRQLEKVRPKT